MGVVYRAVDERLDRSVALKSLPVEVAADPSRLARFEREAKTLARVVHANVAMIFGVEVGGDDTPYLVLELVEGEDFEELLKRGALPLDTAVDLCDQVAAGLVAVHAAVPLVVLMRLKAELGFAWYTYPPMIICYFGGQFVGSRLRRRRQLAAG